MLKRSSSRHIRSMHLKFAAFDSKNQPNKQLSDQEVKEKYSDIKSFSEKANHYEKLEFMLTVFALLRKEATLELQKKEPASELTTPLSKLPKKEGVKKRFIVNWILDFSKLFKKKSN